MTTNVITDTILYHANCSDGMLAAFCCYVAAKDQGRLDQCEFIAVQYGSPPPEVSGTSVTIVDFSYAPDYVQALTDQGKKVMLIDHHASAATQFGGYNRELCCDPDERYRGKGEQGGGLFTRLISDEASGCLLTHRVFADASHRLKNNARLKWMLERVSDWDTWKHALEGTTTLIAMLRFKITDTNNMEAFETLEEMVFQWTVEEFEMAMAIGSSIEAYRAQLVAGYAEKAQTLVMDPQAGLESELVGTNVPSNFATEVGSSILSKHIGALAAMWVSAPQRTIVSLRSTKEGPDAEQFARMYGGGGHRNAAAIAIHTHELPDFLNGKFKHQWLIYWDGLVLHDGVWVPIAQIEEAKVNFSSSKDELLVCLASHPSDARVITLRHARALHQLPILTTP